MYSYNKALAKLGGQSNILFNYKCIFSIGADRCLSPNIKPANEIAVLIGSGYNSDLTAGQKCFGCSIHIFNRNATTAHTTYSYNRALAKLSGQSNILFNYKCIFSVGADRCLIIANKPAKEYKAFSRSSNNFYVVTYNYIGKCSYVVGYRNGTTTVALDGYFTND